MSDFPVPPEDCTFLGMPIDYVAFKDTGSKTKCSVHFVEVKSGSAFLMGKQKNIKKVHMSTIIKPELYFKNDIEWRNWLAENHVSSNGVYLIFYKVAMMLCAPLTTSFNSTLIFEFKGKKKSTLEPNFMKPASVPCTTCMLFLA